MAMNVTEFSPKVVSEIFNAVKGKSALARLSSAKPIAFTGNREMVFTMDKEVDIVAENGPKTVGGATVEGTTVVPIKFEYGARVSDEFMYAAEEDQLNILETFNEGFARKLARGMDIAAFHGFNPRTGQASQVVGGKNFDNAVTQTVTYAAGKEDANIEAAVALIDAAGGETKGIAMSPAMRSALAALTANGAKVFPELAWGQAPEYVNGLRTEVNSTVSPDYAILGDFDAFRWGFAKDINLEVIPYGDPDNSGSDLKGHNQVYLRAEAYIGWAILDPSAFAIIKAGA